MQRGIEHVVYAAALDDLSRVHDAHLVGEPGDHGEIVGDPDQRRAGFAAQLLHLNRSALDGDIQRGRRLVGDDDLGPVQQRDRDRDPLSHAAGELMWIAAQALVRGGDAHLRQRLARALPRESLVHRFMGEDRLDHLGIDAQHRIRVIIGSWNTIAMRLPRIRRRSRSGRPRRSFPSSRMRPPTMRRVDRPAHDRVAGHRLARTRFAHQAHDFSRRDAEADVLHRLHHALAGGEVGPQAFTASVVRSSCARCESVSECARVRSRSEPRRRLSCDQTRPDVPSPLISSCQEKSDEPRRV